MIHLLLKIPTQFRRVSLLTGRKSNYLTQFKNMKKLLFTAAILFAGIAFSNAQTILLNEGFEENGTPPKGWSGMGIFNANGTNLWEEAAANSIPNSNISPYQGSYMAALWDQGFISCVTDLVPPFLNLKSYTNVKLKFYYIATHYFSPYDDSLGVFYYIGKHGALHALPITGYKTVNSNTNPQWDSTTLSIPGGSDSVFIDFRGYYNQDNGIFIDNVTVTGTSTAGVDNMETSAASINVYPNPSSGAFNLVIASETKQSQCKVELYNLLGEQVYEEALNQSRYLSGQGNNTINISNQPNGIYLYKVITEAGALVGQGKLLLAK